MIFPEESLFPEETLKRTLRWQRNMARTSQRTIINVRSHLSKRSSHLWEFLRPCWRSIWERRKYCCRCSRGTQPVLLNETSNEPDCRFQTNPGYLIQISQRKLEPRYALFKDAFFHEASMPKGNIRVAIKFGDILCPINPIPPKVLPAASLPKPTEDLDRVRADIGEFGYGIVKNALAPEQIANLKQAVLEQAAGEVAAGVAAKDRGPNAPNQRIRTLINKGQEFIGLLQHPLIDEIVPEFLGEHALIHGYSSNIA